MKILVINAGSSSLKYQLFDMAEEKLLAKGNCEKIGLEGSIISLKAHGEQKIFDVVLKNHEDAMANVLKILLDKENNILSSLAEIGAVGHRVLHGGEIYTKSVLVDDEVMANLEELKPLGPLHMPANMFGIKACQEAMPGVPQVAVFDTEFHSTMPDYAYRYAIPKKAYTDWKIRKYGFHGTSHKFVANELEKLTGKKGKFIICHVGNGASVSAVVDGKSVETSMGFTPLEGLVMGTRSGDIDPAVVERIMQMSGKTVGETLNYLNKESGLLGVSGISSDIRDIQKVAEGNEDAQLAIRMLCYRIKKYIGEYVAVLNGVDAIAFTAGTGENRPEIRQEILEGLDWLGIEVDKDRNFNFVRGENYDITGANSRCKIYVVPTDEELMIARDTKEIVEKL
ncbi:MAG: acetate kinase [Clostridia bacterium]|nr:acetate kinase [Clostridia bacterium]